MIVGHVGCRQGSKGLPNKNKKILLDRPLFVWSIEHLLECPEVDEFVVSTDDEEIYSVALDYGALDVGMRCAKLADDNISKLDVWKDSLGKTTKFLGQTPDALLDLDCTSPLRQINDMSRAVEIFNSTDVDLVMSCCEARKNPYFNLLEFADNGTLTISKASDKPIVARQQAPVVLEHVASIYVMRPTYLLRADHLLDGNVKPFLMPFERSWDIDSEFDFRFCEYLLSSRSLHGV